MVMNFGFDWAVDMFVESGVIYKEAERYYQFHFINIFEMSLSELE